jgi:hypothetical protein
MTTPASVDAASDPIRTTTPIGSIILLVAFILAPKVGIWDFSALIVGAWFLATWPRSQRPLVVSTERSSVIPVSWLMLVAIAIIGFLYHGQNSSEMLFKPIRQLMLLPILADLFIHQRLRTKDAAAAALAAATVNGIVIIAQYVAHATGRSPNLLLVPGFDPAVNVPFRKPGLTAGFPVAGMLCVLGIVLAASWMKVRRSPWLIAALIVCAASVVVTSRMALLFACLCILIFVLPSAVASVRMWILYTSLTVVAVVAVRQYSHLLHYDTINVMFELFINLIVKGKLETQSSTALIESYALLPQNLSTLLIGNGFTTASDTHLTVDAGLQVVLFGSGIFGLGLYLLLSFLYFRYALAATRGTVFAKAVVVFFGLMMVSNFKTEAFFSRSFGDAFLLLVAAGFARDVEGRARVRAHGSVDPPPRRLFPRRTTPELDLSPWN